MLIFFLLGAAGGIFFLAGFGAAAAAGLNPAGEAAAAGLKPASDAAAAADMCVRGSIARQLWKPWSSGDSLASIATWRGSEKQALHQSPHGEHRP